MKTDRRILRWASSIAGLLVPAVVVSDIWLDIDYRVAANVCLAFAAALVTLFTGLYAFRSKWKTNRIGPVYLVKCIAMTLFLVQAAVAVWIDQDYPFRQQIRFAIYAYVAVVYVPMCITLWLEQQRDRRGEGAPSFPPS